MRVTALNTLYAEPNRYTFSQPKTLTYEGDEVPAPGWAAKGTIALATGNPGFPVRLIDPDLIVSVNDEIIQESKSKLDIRTVVVEGSKGQKYIVTITPTSKTCTCVGFGFRRNCRHLNMACD